MTDPVSLPLLQHADPTTAGEFDPETGAFRSYARAAAAGAWCPPVRERGWFGQVGWRGELVIFYRDAGGTLGLYVGGRRVAITARMASQYEPADPSRPGWRDRVTGRRVFRLVEGGAVVFEYRYRGDTLLDQGAGIAADIGSLTLSRSDQHVPYDVLFAAHWVLSDPAERARAFEGPAHCAAT